MDEQREYNIAAAWDGSAHHKSNEIDKMRQSRTLTDVRIAGADGEVLHAHSLILAASSPYFLRHLQVFI